MNSSENLIMSLVDETNRNRMFKEKVEMLLQTSKTISQNGFTPDECVNFVKTFNSCFSNLYSTEN